MRKMTPIIPLLLAVLAVACCPCPEEQLEANKALVNRFTEVVNSADWDALDELLTESFRRHSQATPGEPVKSLEEFKELQRSFAASMPDQHISAEMLLAEGDMVAALATYSGTMTGPMGPFPATGKSAAVKFLTIFRIEEGRIAELWVEWDNLAMFSQLGLYPPPPAPAE